MTNELQNIISGTSEVGFGNLIQTTLNYLRTSEGTSKKSEREKYFKKQEEQELIKHIESKNLWVTDIDFNSYISEGAEQKVYLKSNTEVWKLNDAIYYESWSDYFINLLLNNYFFPDTAYDLRGFYLQEDNSLCSCCTIFYFSRRNYKFGKSERIYA